MYHKKWNWFFDFNDYKNTQRGNREIECINIKIPILFIQCVLSVGSFLRITISTNDNLQFLKVCICNRPFSNGHLCSIHFEHWLVKMEAYLICNTEQVSGLQQLIWYISMLRRDSHCSQVRGSVTSLVAFFCGGNNENLVS